VGSEERQLKRNAARHLVGNLEQQRIQHATLKRLRPLHRVAGEVGRGSGRGGFFAGVTLNFCELICPSPRLGSTLPRESVLVLHDEFVAVQDCPPDVLQHFFFVAVLRCQQFTGNLQFVLCRPSGQADPE
jgi:hypothetical protein